jgi:hypothetical protein
MLSGCQTTGMQYIFRKAVIFHRIFAPVHFIKESGALEQSGAVICYNFNEAYK